MTLLFRVGQPLLLAGCIYFKNDLLIGYWTVEHSVSLELLVRITVTVDRNVDYTQDPLGFWYKKHHGSVNSKCCLNTVLLWKVIYSMVVIMHGFWYVYAPTGQKVILELAGTGSIHTPVHHFCPGSLPVEMNKGSDQTSSFVFNQHFTLNGQPNSSPKHLSF